MNPLSPSLNLSGYGRLAAAPILRPNNDEDTMVRNPVEAIRPWPYSYTPAAEGIQFTRRNWVYPKDKSWKGNNRQARQSCVHKRRGRVSDTALLGAAVERTARVAAPITTPSPRLVSGRLFPSWASVPAAYACCAIAIHRSRADSCGGVQPCADVESSGFSRCRRQHLQLAVTPSRTMYLLRALTPSTHLASSYQRHHMSSRIEADHSPQNARL